MGARDGVREAAWTESKELKVVRSREMAVKWGRVGWTGGELGRRTDRIGCVAGERGQGEEWRGLTDFWRDQDRG